MLEPKEVCERTPSKVLLCFVDFLLLPLISLTWCVTAAVWSKHHSQSTWPDSWSELCWWDQWLTGTLSPLKALKVHKAFFFFFEIFLTAEQVKIDTDKRQEAGYTLDKSPAQLFRPEVSFELPIYLSPNELWEEAREPMQTWGEHIDSPQKRPWPPGFPTLEPFCCGAALTTAPQYSPKIKFI